MPSLLSTWPTMTLLFFSLLPFMSSASNASAFNSSRREVVTARRGVVAADDGRCSRIGRDVLREGGHAVDASVAVALCLGVVSPASSGIGGGAFMLIRLADGTTQALDMRETAPIKASENMYTENATLKYSGALSVAVPGDLAGLHQAWKLYGRLPWKRLVKPAEILARNGFKISPYLHMQMVKTESGIMSDVGLRNLFTSRGALLEPGHLCRNQKLAKTLREISEHGVEAFYNGSVGLNLVKDVKKAGGILTMEDLRRYQVKHREPVSADILGLKVLRMPPPSSGGAAMILILNILAQYGFPLGVSGSLGIHREIEALKHALAVRISW